MKKKATIVILFIVNANSVSAQSLKSSPLLHTGNEDGNNKKNELPLSLPSTLPSSSPSSSEISHSFSLGYASMAGVLIFAVSLIVMQVLFSGCGLTGDHRHADDVSRDGVDTDSDLYLNDGDDMDDSDLSGVNGPMDTSLFLYVGGLILVHAFFLISSGCDNRPDRSYDGVDFSDLYLNDNVGDDTNSDFHSLDGSQQNSKPDSWRHSFTRFLAGTVEYLQNLMHITRSAMGTVETSSVSFVQNDASQISA